MCCFVLVDLGDRDLSSAGLVGLPGSVGGSNLGSWPIWYHSKVQRNRATMCHLIIRRHGLHRHVRSVLTGQDHGLLLDAPSESTRNSATCSSEAERGITGGKSASKSASSASEGLAKLSYVAKQRFRRDENREQNSDACQGTEPGPA